MGQGIVVDKGADENEDVIGVVTERICWGVAAQPSRSSTIDGGLIEERAEDKDDKLECNASKLSTGSLTKEGGTRNAFSGNNGLVGSGGSSVSNAPLAISTSLSALLRVRLSSRINLRPYLVDSATVVASEIVDLGIVNEQAVLSEGHDERASGSCFLPPDAALCILLSRNLLFGWLETFRRA